MLENALKYLSILTVGAIILGYIKLNSYYQAFNIDIINYIGTPEMLYALLPLSTVVFTLGYSWIYLDKSNAKPSLSPKIKSLLTKRLRIIIFIVGLLFILLYCYLEINLKIYRAQPLMELLFFLFLGVILASPFKNAWSNNNVPIIQLVIIYIFIGFVVMRVNAALANNIKYFGSDKSYYFKWKDKTIRTDSSLMLIGETQSYIFLYNKKDASTIAFKRSEIDSLAVKK